MSQQFGNGCAMRYLAIATDYDGTLATQGEVEAEVLQSLRELSKSGRKLILVTGRELLDLERVFPQYAVFDRIVAENGGVMYAPKENRELMLCEAPSDDLINLLKVKGVEPMSVGRTIVATWTPHDVAVLESIRELGLELQITFNKGAVMILPTGVNKGTGLQAALEDLKLHQDQVVGLGDAENDHALLAACGFAVAVSNALPSLKERADHVTPGARGAGVMEIITELLRDDLSMLAQFKERKAPTRSPGQSYR